MSADSNLNVGSSLFARLLFDVMIPPEPAAAIRSQGYDVLGAGKLPTEVFRDDQRLLEVATEQRRVLITCNYSDQQSNFVLIHEEWQAQRREHAGTLLCPQSQISSRYRRREARDRLPRFLNEHTWSDLYNRLFWLPLK